MDVVSFEVLMNDGKLNIALFWSSLMVFWALDWKGVSAHLSPGTLHVVGFGASSEFLTNYEALNFKVQEDTKLVPRYLTICEIMLEDLTFT
jgi:hypothetical protein